MSRSIKLLAILVVAVTAIVGGALWYFNNSFDDVLVPVATANKVPTLDKPVAEGGTVRAGARILVRRSVAETKPIYVRLQGRTAPARSVDLRVQTSGVVAATLVEQGQMVAEGDMICQLDRDEATLLIKEAESVLAAAQLEYDKTVELIKDGWKGPDAERLAQGVIDSAKADLRAAQLELEKTRIVAPFDGLFELRTAEEGDLLNVGDPCGSLIELDPLLAVAMANEDQTMSIATDAMSIVVHAASDGGQAEWVQSGKVRFAASSADPDTGLFRVEVALDNPDMELRAGQSVEIRIATGEGLAHLVKPAAVVHAEDGQLQVRHVGVDNRIKLSDVQVHDSQIDGVWVSGLPEQALIVVEGQGELPDGMPVDVAIENENS